MRKIRSLRRSARDPSIASTGEHFYRLAGAEHRSPRTRWSKYFALLRAAVEHGHVGAHTELATYYLDGFRAKSGATILPRSPKRARKLFELAANAGDANAFPNLGYCFDAGVGGPKSEKQAVYWYRRAVAHGASSPPTTCRRSFGTVAIEQVASAGYAERSRWATPTRSSSSGDSCCSGRRGQRRRPSWYAISAGSPGRRTRNASRQCIFSPMRLSREPEFLDRRSGRRCGGGEPPKLRRCASMTESVRSSCGRPRRRLHDGKAKSCLRDDP